MERAPDKDKLRLKIPPSVAGYLSGETPDERLAAMRAERQLADFDRLVLLLVGLKESDPLIKQESLGQLKTFPADSLTKIFQDQLLSTMVADFLVALHASQTSVVAAALQHQQLSDQLLLQLAATAEEPVLELLAGQRWLFDTVPQFTATLLENRSLSQSLKKRLLPTLPSEATPGDLSLAEDDAEDDSGDSHQALSGQILLMTVAEKIKLAQSGDREARTLLLRDANKQISAAVLNNPGITEREILAIAQNRNSSSELIRVVLLNRDWIRSYEMKKALVLHPRTPLRVALNFMSFMTQHDLKKIIISRDISSAVQTAARRILQKKN